MLREVPLSELAHRCREETHRFLRGEPRDDSYCFEVFERAVVHRDDDAWAAIIGQYRGIVLAYVGQHTVAAMLRETDDYWVNRAFQRFWTAVGADRFGQFADLPALLKYLKLCVHSVLMDELRSRRARASTSLEDARDELPASTSAEHTVIHDLAGEPVAATDRFAQRAERDAGKLAGRLPGCAANAGRGVGLEVEHVLRGGPAQQVEDDDVPRLPRRRPRRRRFILVLLTVGTGLLRGITAVSRAIGGRAPS